MEKDKRKTYTESGNKWDNTLGNYYRKSPHRTDLNAGYGYYENKGVVNKKSSKVEEPEVKGYNAKVSNERVGTHYGLLHPDKRFSGDVYDVRREEYDVTDKSKEDYLNSRYIYPKENENEVKKPKVNDLKRANAGIRKDEERYDEDKGIIKRKASKLDEPEVKGFSNNGYNPVVTTNGYRTSPSGSKLAVSNVRRHTVDTTPKTNGNNESEEQSTTPTNKLYSGSNSRKAQEEQRYSDNVEKAKNGVDINKLKQAMAMQYNRRFGVNGKTDRAANYDETLSSAYKRAYNKRKG